jgi:amino acid adenylation domain-containing protein
MNRQASFPLDHSLDRLFEAQVERTPDAIAVTCGEGHLTYHELNRRANRLARYLHRLGVGPEVRVGLCVERSLEMMVGLWGILKAGGAYVPLDPAYPPERLMFMVEDAGAPVLLTRQRWAERLGGQTRQVIRLDADWDVIMQEDSENLVSGVTVDNLLYVIYTSGSTGRPKGAGVYQRSFVNLLDWFVGDFGLNEEDRPLIISAQSFDLTQKNLYAPLLVGGTLDLYSSERYDPARILEAIQDRQVTWVNCTPSAFYPLVDPDTPDGFGKLRSVRYVFLGGEPISIPRLWDWLASDGCRAQIVNTYGPTECTDICAMYRVERPESFLTRPVPIGRSLPNVELLILDSQLDLVPAGEEGELCVGGAGVGRGYLNDGALTSTKFVPHPYSQVTGARLYKTGDRARYLPDGNIEFLGRIDYQVKVRGYRIELGGIEAVLEQHPQVREAVIVARSIGDESGDMQLVAYVVAKDPALAPGNLRDWLRAKLPEYMTPSQWVMLPALPLTPSGKVDRRALSTLEHTGSGRAATHASPRTPLEESLAQIWAQTLGVEQVGIHDNFFESGGHSLLATQLLTQIHRLLGCEIEMRILFEAPTVASLAERITAITRTEQEQPTLHIPRAPRDRPLALSFAQQQLWLIDQLEPGIAAYNISYPLRLTGTLDTDALHRSLNEIVRRHESLRTHFAIVDDQPVQVIAPSLCLPLQRIDLRDLPPAEREAEARRLGREQARQAFDLAQGPLLRITLLQLSEAEHILLLTLHHIVVDGWSIGVLLDELGALYTAFMAGKPCNLPELPVQYADYAAWQRDWLQGQELERQLAYWKRQLDGSPALLQLPADRPRPPVQTFQGIRRTTILPQPLSEALQALSQREGVTLFMMLLAAFQVLLYRYTGQTDIVLGSPIANRKHSQIERLIGYFVNPLVLRTNLAGDPTFRELLKRVRETTLEAYAHQDLPFAKLAEALVPQRSRSYNPIFQVMFVLQNTPLTLPTLPNLSVSHWPVDMGIAQFDLLLDMEETPRGLMRSIEYSTDLFDEATITRMLDHHQALLESLAADPDQALAKLLPFATLVGSTSVRPNVTVPTQKSTLAQRRTELAQRKSRLATEQRALLEKRLRGE